MSKSIEELELELAAKKAEYKKELADKKLIEENKALLTVAAAAALKQKAEKSVQTKPSKPFVPITVHCEHLRVNVDWAVCHKHRSYPTTHPKKEGFDITERPERCTSKETGCILYE